MEELYTIAKNMDNGKYGFFGEIYFKLGDFIIWAAIVIIAIIALIIGVFIGQAIIVRMNEKDFIKLKDENGKMHYEIIEYRAKEAYEQKHSPNTSLNFANDWKNEQAQPEERPPTGRGGCN